MVLENGVSTSEVARNLGIPLSVLSRWKSTAKKIANGSINPDEQKELKLLREENLKLKMEREILKKATAFFAVHTK